MPAPYRAHHRLFNCIYNKKDNKLLQRQAFRSVFLALSISGLHRLYPRRQIPVDSPTETTFDLHIT